MERIKLPLVMEVCTDVFENVFHVHIPRLVELVGLYAFRIHDPITPMYHIYCNILAKKTSSRRRTITTVCGVYHSIGEQPAIVYTSGAKIWYYRGAVCRIQGGPNALTAYGAPVYIESITSDNCGSIRRITLYDFLMYCT